MWGPVDPGEQGVGPGERAGRDEPLDGLGESLRGPDPPPDGLAADGTGSSAPPAAPEVPCFLCARPLPAEAARCPSCRFPRDRRLSVRDRWLLLAGFAAVWLATFLGALVLR